MANNQPKGSETDSTKIQQVKLRRRLAFFLNILFWIIFTATFILDYQENKKREISEDVLSGTWEEVTIEMTN